MNSFDPGEGWRRATPEEPKQNGSIRYTNGQDTQVFWWVPVDPVLPLPTVRNTIIDAYFARRGPARLVCDGDDHWSTIGPQQGGRGGWHTDVLQQEITGWRYLAEPVEATVEAVIDTIRQNWPNRDHHDEEMLQEIERQYRLST